MISELSEVKSPYVATTIADCKGHKAVMRKQKVNYQELSKQNFDEIFLAAFHKLYSEAMFIKMHS